MSRVDQLLLKTRKGDCFEKERDAVCKFFKDDSLRVALLAKLCVFHRLYQFVTGYLASAPSIDGIKAALQSLTTTQRQLVASACRLFLLVTILPAMNATSKHSFNALD